MTTKKKTASAFWYQTENNYGGPYTTIEEARAEGEAISELWERISIHQLVEVSEAPKRTWGKV